MGISREKKVQGKLGNKAWERRRAMEEKRKRNRGTKEKRIKQAADE